MFLPQSYPDVVKNMNCDKTLKVSRPGMLYSTKSPVSQFYEFYRLYWRGKHADRAMLHYIPQH